MPFDPASRTIVTSVATYANGAGKSGDLQPSHCDIPRLIVTPVDSDGKGYRETVASMATDARTDGRTDVFESRDNRTRARRMILMKQMTLVFYFNVSNFHTKLIEAYLNIH